MNIHKLATFAASAMALTVAIAATPAPAQAECIIFGGFVEICDTNSSNPSTTPVASRTIYDVTEHNPFTGAQHSRNTYNDYYEAERAYNQRSQAHWAEWRYWGIGEQNHRRRFNSYSEAQAFLASNPCNGSPVCVIEHKAVVAAEVHWTER